MRLEPGVRIRCIVKECGLDISDFELNFTIAGQNCDISVLPRLSPESREWGRPCTPGDTTGAATERMGPRP